MTQQQYEQQKKRIEDAVSGVKVTPEMYGKEVALVACSSLVSPAPKQILHTVQDVDAYLNRYQSGKGADRQA
jgi:hypothetical protein